jgi:beta-glucuronidase
MLFPQFNNFRYLLDLSGVWKFKPDPQKEGEQNKWYEGFESNIDIAVPGSWNEQLEELGLLNFVGAAWYNHKVYIPKEFSDKKVWLRIGSADYYSKLWINGKFVGENKVGFLPFEFDISSFITPGKEAEITLMVNSELNCETIPQGISPKDFFEQDRLREETYPTARFDFFPFGGIHRPVKIFTTPTTYIDEIKIDTIILPEGTGLAKVKVGIKNGQKITIEANIEGLNEPFISSNTDENGESIFELRIDNCQFWSSINPHLYKLNIQLKKDHTVIDKYAIEFGVREITVKENKLYLNGDEIYLKGFGKHEDFSVIGKGLFLPLIIKDFQLLKWINANSFRTSHYPYAEEIMYMADKKGFLIIDEVPAVSLDFRCTNDRTLVNHKESIKKLIARDYNHPSVIMWALGNEPNLVGEDTYYNGTGKKYWKEIFEYSRKLDSTRPMTVPNCFRAGINDPVFEFSDIITLNRYYGWYEYPGQLEHAISLLSTEMDAVYAKYGKPIMLTEFGADTIPGLHSTSDQMFTEEYQEKFLEMYVESIRSKNYTVGEHVWNFADFRTPQHFRRVVFNMKGVFTRDRAPKNAAFKLQKIWSQAKK